MKPDFGTAIETYILASSGPDVSIERGASFILDALNAAFNAGLERAAEICQSRYMGDNNREDMEAQRCSAAIRAEKEPQ